MVILFSGRTSQPCSTADDRVQTHAEHVIEDSAELSTHKSPSIAEGGAPTTVVQEQISWRNARARRLDDFELKGGFRWLTSAGKLQVLKSKLPLETSMSEIRFGRSECAVRAYLTNGILGKADLKLLRDYLKQVGVGG